MPRKILLVEDEAIIAMAQRSKLSRLGYEALVAPNGEAAVERALAEEDLSLILMDIDLGKGIDGTEAAKRILAARELPIVFLTSHSEREMVEKVRGITRYGYVIKNSGDFVLQSSIEMAFELFDAHRKLRAEETRLLTVLKTIPDLMWLKDVDGVYLGCNWMFERYFGAPAARIVGRTDYDFVDRDIADSFRERDRLALEADRPLRNEEWITFKDTGQRALLETVKTPMRDERGRLIGILGVGRDITEYRKTQENAERSAEALKESESRARLVFESFTGAGVTLDDLELQDFIDAPLFQTLMEDFSLLTGMGIGIFDTQGRALVATGWQPICTEFHRSCPGTRAFCKESDSALTFGLAEGEVKYYHCRNQMRDVATPIYLGGRQVGTISTGQFFFEDEAVDAEAFRAQARLHGFPEEEYLAALAAVPRWNRERIETTMRFYAALAHLIGTLGFGNIKLAKVVSEKETLLKELKHRVKNSLSLVSGLLSANRDARNSDSCIDLIDEAVARVQSVSAIYDRLSMSEAVESIDLASYVEDLVAMLERTYTDVARGLRLRVRAAPLDVPMRKAVPLGLVLNELVTNAIKYAYPPDSGGEVRVSLYADGGDAELRVDDDGPGLPPGFDPERAESLGLRISYMLARQLRGDLRFEPGPGTHVRLRFSREDPA